MSLSFESLMFETTVKPSFLKLVNEDFLSKNSVKSNLFFPEKVVASILFKSVVIAKSLAFLIVNS